MSSAGPFKIVVLGEGRVGKTSLLRRYLTQSFDGKEASTQSAAYNDKTITIRGCKVQLSLWDTAGQERFHSLAPIYYRDADGALLVYDITDAQSFERVAKWVKELKQVANNKSGRQTCLCIVGNKMDLRGQAAVSAADSEAYAQSIGARALYASAKSGQGVEDAFSRLSEDVLDSYLRSRGGAQGGATSTRPKKGALICDDEDLPAISAANSTRNDRISLMATPSVQRRRKRDGCCGGGGSDPDRASLNR